MQLSLWTIADNMTTMETQLQVERGLCQLRNARLLTDASEIKHFTLYLQQNERNTVLCMNGNDVMIVRSDDVDRVLNEILDVFDRFNEWEAEIDSLIASGGTLEDVLSSAAQQLKMHLMMADATYYIHEFAACSGESLPVEWEGLVSQRSMDLESIMLVDANPAVRRADAGIYYVQVPEYELDCPVGNLFTGESHKGWVIGLRDGGGFSQGDLDLMQFVVHKVEDWLRENASNEAYLEQTGVFTRLLEGADVTSFEAERALATFAWRDGDRLRVYVAHRVDRQGKPSVVAARFMRQARPNSFVVAYGDGLVIISNESLETPDESDEFKRVLKTCGYAAGSSAVFQDVMQLKQHHDAAAIAAASGAAGEVVDFESVKMAYALSIIREHAVADIEHRALGQLAEYDAEHNAPLLETLECFVDNRGRYVATCEELVIHRSTLLYRLGRIEELTGIDFSDRETWEHLVLSFMVRGKA